jgi:hypothetical protein
VFVVLFGVVSLYNSQPSVRVQKILAGAEFAELPESAMQIKIMTWYTPFSGEEYLRFRASPDDIKSFLEKSPILNNVEFEKYSDKKMRLFSPHRDVFSSSSLDNHEYINKKPTAPSWYMQEIKDIARRYRIQPKGYNSAGELIVEERNNLVFIKLIPG